MKEMLKEVPLGIRQLFTSITHLKEGEKVLVITDDNKKKSVSSYINMLKCFLKQL